MQNVNSERDFNPTGRNPVPAHRRRSDASLVLIVNVVALAAILLAGSVTLNAAQAGPDNSFVPQIEITRQADERSDRNLIIGGALSLAALALIGFRTRGRRPTRSVKFHPKQTRDKPPFDAG